MGIFKETIGTLTVSSTTQLTLVGRTVVRLGGLFKVLNSPTLSTAVTGIGGLDTGTIAASTFYYVYAVSNGTAHGIVASTSNQIPTGFTRYKKVGAFYTNASSQVFKAYVYGDINPITLTAYATSTGVVSREGGQPSDWINGNATSISNAVFTYSINAGVFSLPPQITGSADGDNGVFQASLGAAASTSAFSYRTQRMDNVAAVMNANIFAHKQGVDAIQPDWKDY